MGKKYVLLKEKNENGLRRIKALRDIAGICVKGALGGWIETEINLSQDGDAWVSGNARVYGNAWVYGNAQVSGDAWAKSPLYIQGTRDALTTSSKTHISIGCECHSISKWMKKYKAIGRMNHYSKEEIEEYGKHLKYAGEWLKRWTKPSKKRVLPPDLRKPK